MTVEIVEITPENKDGFASYSFEENGKSIGFLYSSVTFQKGLEGSTLRVREITIYPNDEDPLLTVTKIFTSIFAWNNTDNIKFYIDTRDTLFLFTVFGALLTEREMITSMEHHSQWVIFKGIK